MKARLACSLLVLGLVVAGSQLRCGGPTNEGMVAAEPPADLSVPSDPYARPQSLPPRRAASALLPGHSAASGTSMAWARGALQFALVWRRMAAVTCMSRTLAAARFARWW